jgi:N,N-dimethylformamidase
MLLRITGYSDKYSVHPGEEVKFFVNSEKNETYEAQLVRLIHGDTNPEGPGYKEEEISASCKVRTKLYMGVRMFLYPSMKISM